MKLSDIKVGDVIIDDLGTSTITESQTISTSKELSDLYHDKDTIPINHLWRLFCGDKAFWDDDKAKSDIIRIERDNKVIFERE